MFSIVSEKYSFIAGVDTHARKHALIIVNSLGAVIGSREFRVLERDFLQTTKWVHEITSGKETLFAIEGTSSYGESLTRFLMRNGYDVCEAKPPKTRSRGSKGKDDLLDAKLAALSVLSTPINKLIYPRSDGLRKALRTLLAARRNMITQQVMNKNALISLARTNNIGIDARKPLKPREIEQIANWRIGIDGSVDIELSTARIEAKRLAKTITRLNDELAENNKRLDMSVRSIASSLLSMIGVGPVVAAQLLCAYSHKGRIRSAAAFANLAGTTPIPASSGNVVRHRLNRYGDRQLNQAIDVIAISRMRTDETTKIYVEKRTQNGLSMREIKRSLKRYIARSIFKILETLEIGG